MRQKNTLFFLVLTICVVSIKAQTIWDGPPVIFTKTNGADWTQEANQDRITENVWITRKNSEGLFNINQEATYDLNTSPVDTEWGAGTTADLGSIVFEPWRASVQGSPPSYVGVDMVVHLITEDIYIDIKLLSWSQGGSGGGFSYERSTPSILGTNDFKVNKIDVFPNPASSYLNFENQLNGVKGKIYDISGREIMDVKVENNKLDIHHLINGIYFLKIEGYSTTRLIKNN